MDRFEKIEQKPYAYELDFVEFCVDFYLCFPRNKLIQLV